MLVFKTKASAYQRLDRIFIMATDGEATEEETGDPEKFVIKIEVKVKTQAGFFYLVLERLVSLLSEKDLVFASPFIVFQYYLHHSIKDKITEK